MGHGKTFFLERFAQSLAAEGHIVATVNAWRDDHADDPLTAVMAAIDDAVMPLLGSRREIKKKWKSVLHSAGAVTVAATKGAAKYWISKAVGEGLDDAFEVAKAATKSGESELAGIIDEQAKLLLASFKEGQRSIEKFRNELKTFLDDVGTKDKKMPLFVLVDELDRCRPSYAITLLERVKHLFEIDNVVFVFATDADQLQHAIGAVYGIGFDSQRYLLRFFDRAYRFEPPSLEGFVSMLIASHQLDTSKLSLPPRQTLEGFVSGGFSFFGLSLRDTEQCFDILRSIITTWRSKLPLEIAVLLPTIIAYQQSVSIDGNNVMKLAKLANKGNANAWRVEFLNPPEGGQGSRETTSGLDLFATFLGKISQRLDEVSRRQHPGEKEDWISHQFAAELSTLHRNTIHPGVTPLYSIMKEYPALVRTAGRLVPGTPAAQNN